MRILIKTRRTVLIDLILFEDLMEIREEEEPDDDEQRRKLRGDD